MDTKAIGTEGTGYIPQEDGIMFTESQIGWLRSLVKRGRKYEKSRWNLSEIMASIGGSLFLAGGLSLMTTTFDITTQQRFIIALWVMTIVGAILGIIGVSMNYFETQQHISCLEEIDNILKAKETVLNEQQNSTKISNGQ